jgi:hypothetical protein
MRALLIALFGLSAVPAAAANYEGVYNVSLALKPGLDGPTCPAYDVKSVRVEKGQIQTGAGPSPLTGTVSESGQFKGHLRKADGGDVAFDGFVQNYDYDTAHIHINATIVDMKAGCGWSLQLTHE